jgi:hypothetical protein
MVRKPDKPDSGSYMKDITFQEAQRVDPAPSHTITDALVSLWRDPSRFVRHWNYKGAILSGVLRAPIFLVTYLIGKESLRLAVGAAFVQFVFRFFFAGIGGTLIQSMRRVEPAWKAIAAVLLLVPAISHLFEFGVQATFAWATGTQDQTGGAILRSICVSIISALFTVFAMRRGVMIVGESESKSFLNDMSRLPAIIFHFIAFIPNEISSMLRRGAYLAALMAIIGFGIFSELMIWAITNRAYWTFGGGKSYTLLKYWGVDGIILLLITIIMSSIYYNMKRKR